MKTKTFPVVGKAHSGQNWWRERSGRAKREGRGKRAGQEKTNKDSLRIQPPTRLEENGNNSLPYSGLIVLVYALHCSR